MAGQPLPNTKLATFYTARLLLGNNTDAARQLGKIFGWGNSTVRARLQGHTEAEVKDALLSLIDAEKAPTAAPDAPLPTIDEHITIARLRRDLHEAKRRGEELALGLGDAQDFRTNILGLVGEPLYPRKIVAPKGNRRAMTWVINLFDNHLGKRVAPEEVSGLQTYNVEIARNRVARTFAKSVELIKLNGSPVDRILVVFGGDNVNGALRLDDDRNNEISPFAQSRAFAECARDGLDFLLGEFKCDLDAVWLPGNHGRTTANPPSVEIGENYDCIAGALVEWHYQNHPRVHVSNTGQADALIDIYGRGYLFTHGDRIGTGGGDGQIGALGPTKRGSLKIGQQQIEIGKYIEGLPDLAAVIMGHYHVHWTDFDVYVSGAACGPDPWAFLKLRAKPKPPYQWLLGIEAEKGIIEEKRLFVGHPDEGPICSFRSS